MLQPHARTGNTRELFRGAIFHTPRNPFVDANALEVHSRGALLVEDGRIDAIGDFTELEHAYPDATVRDFRGSFILPGFVDTHVHYPQLRILGAFGQSLLDWLRNSALPEEARMSCDDHARQIGCEFLWALASHGTTTALVFGAHFAGAMEIFFEQARQSGLRIASGLVLSDRMLLPELHVTPDEAYRQSTELIRRYHGKDGLSYAVTPRFALSTSEAMLEVCGSLMSEHRDLLFQSHINENFDEVAEVRRLFPWARDYVAVYEKFGLLSERSVLAHNVHTSDDELHRLATHGTSIAHCPSSNAALGSGLFPMRRHVAAGVHVSLGTDVGAGTGFGMLKEALQVYLLQRLSPEGLLLTPAHMLFLATRAGAEALRLDDTGDLSPGMSADFVCLRPPERSVLASAVRNAENEERVLAALFAMAGAESVIGTWVRGKQVYAADPGVL